MRNMSAMGSLQLPHTTHSISLAYFFDRTDGTTIGANALPALQSHGAASCPLVSGVPFIGVSSLAKVSTDLDSASSDSHVGSVKQECPLGGFITSLRTLLLFFLDNEGLPKAIDCLASFREKAARHAPNGVQMQFKGISAFSGPKGNRVIYADPVSEGGMTNELFGLVELLQTHFEEWGIRTQSTDNKTHVQGRRNDRDANVVMLEGESSQWRKGSGDANASWRNTRGADTRTWRTSGGGDTRPWRNSGGGGTRPWRNSSEGASSASWGSGGSANQGQQSFEHREPVQHGSHQSSSGFTPHVTLAKLSKRYESEIPFIPNGLWSDYADRDWGTHTFSEIVLSKVGSKNPDGSHATLASVCFVDNGGSSPMEVD
ncbi:hypothetical protein BJ742DRAFT_826643 [Cladochytrium replicatum]|nr:hypothetical protein BJ742DRAFT_826643 [Cladochytrium replicatum]